MTNSPTLKVTFERLKNSPSKLKKTPINDFAFLPYLCNVDKEQKDSLKQTRQKFSNKQIKETLPIRNKQNPSNWKLVISPYNI